MTTRELELADYAAVLRRRIRWIVGAALIVFGLVAVYTLTRTPSYSATSEVLVRTADTDTLFGTSGDASAQLRRNPVAEYQFASGGAFRSAANEQLGAPGYVFVTIKALPVEQGPNQVSSVLQFTGQADDAEAAAAAANAYAEAYVSVRNQDDVDAMTERREALSQRLESLQGELDALTAPLAELDAQIAAENDPDVRANLVSQRSETDADLGSARRELDLELAGVQNSLSTTNQTLRLLENTEASARVLNVASPPGAPSSPPVNRNLVLGAVAGIVLGLALALFVEAIDDRVGDASGRPTDFDLPVLSSVPELPTRADGPGGIARFAELDIAASEPYRTLRNALMFLQSDPPFQAIVVTADSVGAGCTQTAANLAEATTGLTANVVVVDTDLREGSLAERLEVDADVGLADVLTGRHELDDAVHSTRNPLLSVVAAGTADEDPSDLLASERFSDVVEELRRRYDVIIFDAPSAVSVSDAWLVSTHADAVVVVYDVRRSKNKRVQGSIDLLASTGARVVGTVANRTEHPMAAWSVHRDLAAPAPAKRALNGAATARYPSPR